MDRCPKCVEAKNKLEAKGVEFKEINAYTEEGLLICRKLNLTSAGVVLDENNNIIDINDL